MSHLLSLGAQAWIIVLLAEFLAGLVHWIMDTYVTDDMPVLGPLLSRTNTLHHHHPRACTRVSFWATSWESLIIAAAILGVAFACGTPGWRTWLFATVVASASLIHKWAHRTRRENGALISWLQTFGVLQHPQHHAVHHTDPKDTYYCTVTNCLNPLLERIDFWARAERLVAAVFRVHRKPDTSVRGRGPAPAWITERLQAERHERAHPPRAENDAISALAPIRSGSAPRMD